MSTQGHCRSWDGLEDKQKIYDKLVKEFLHTCQEIDNRGDMMNGRELYLYHKLSELGKVPKITYDSIQTKLIRVSDRQANFANYLLSKYDFDQDWLVSYGRCIREDETK